MNKFIHTVLAILFIVLLAQRAIAQIRIVTADPSGFRLDTPDTRHNGPWLTPPPVTVLTTTPVRNGLHVSRTTWIDVIFSQPIDIGSLVMPGAFTATGSVSGIHPGVAVQGSTGRDIRFFPDTPFAIGELVTVSLTSAVTGSSGGALVPHVFAFTIQSVASVPTVTRGSGTLTGSERWTGGAVYLIAGNLTVPAGLTLTIDPGAIVKLAGGSLLVAGGLVASGTGAAPVVFTSNRDDVYGGDSNADGTATSGQPGDWGVVRLNPTSALTYSIGNAVFRFGGGLAGEPHMVRVTGQASLSMADCVVEGSRVDGVRIDSAASGLTVARSVFYRCQYGLYATGFATGLFTDSIFTLCNLPISQAGTAPVYSNNVFTGNAFQAIAVGETLTQNVLWQNLGIAYLIDRDLVVPAGRTLTIEAGVVAKFQAASGNAYRRNINVLGGFVMQSTPANPIVFTSSQDDEYAGDTNGDRTGSNGEPGHWAFIVFRGSSNVVFHDAIVRFGGRHRVSDGWNWWDSSSESAQLRVSEAANVTVASARIESAWRTGVLAQSNSATLVMRESMVRRCVFGIYCDAIANGRVESSFISENTYPVCQAGSDLVYVDNVFLNNTWQVIAVEGVLTRDVVWDDVQSLGMPYLVIGDLTVPASFRLLVDAGIVIKFMAVSGNSYRRNIDVAGGLELRSTAQQPIVFTSSSDDAFGGDTNRDGSTTVPVHGDWAFVRIKGSAVVYFRNAIVRFGGRHRVSDGWNWWDDTNLSSSLFASEQATLLIQDCLVEQSWRSAVACHGAGARLVVNQCALRDSLFGLYCSATAGTTLQSSTLARNRYPVCQGGTDIAYFNNRFDSNAFPVIAVEGTLHRDVVWEDVQDLRMPYNIIGDLTVPVGMSLAIEGGVVVKFDAVVGDSYRRAVDVLGVLETRSSVCAPVVFTSMRDDQYGGDANMDGAGSAPSSGDWGFIRFRGSGISNVHDVILRFGGRYRVSDGWNWWDDPINSSQIVVAENATLTLRDSILDQSWYRNVMFTSPTAVMSVDNVSLLAGRASPNNLGVENSTSRGVTATNVWWGDSSGPSGDGPGSGASVRGNVVFRPWRTRQGFLAAGVESTGGDALGAVPSAGTVLDTWESNTFVRAFNERLNIRLPTNLVVETSSVGTIASSGQLAVSTIAAGTFVNSHLLHLNSQGTTALRRQGTVTFDTTILGVIVTSARLASTDGLMGDPGLGYPVAASRGIELDAPAPNDDEFEILSDRRTIRFLGSVGVDVDQVRVITAAARDCNANGRPDSCDIGEGSSLDLNSDGFPDECGERCIPDFNNDGGVDGSDLGAFFVSWEAGDAAADVNRDGGIDGADIATFYFMWQRGVC